jgi:Epoxide hydrolase N terminus
MPDDVTDFRIEVPEAELEDLRARLQRTRWPERETVEDWSQGVPLAYLRDLCGYWADRYDWRATEMRLNALAQLRTVIDGLGIHFLHVRSPHPDALPSSSRTAGPAPSSSSSTSSARSATRPRTAATPPTPSTSSARRSRAMASATSRRGPAGAWSGSPPPGPPSWHGWDTSATRAGQRLGDEHQRKRRPARPRACRRHSPHATARAT